jgi:hypothetical protein
VKHAQSELKHLKEEYKDHIAAASRAQMLQAALQGVDGVLRAKIAAATTAAGGDGEAGSGGGGGGRGRGGGGAPSFNAPNADVAVF